jgi:hypothetical protein
MTSHESLVQRGELQMPHAMSQTSEDIVYGILGLARSGLPPDLGDSVRLYLNCAARTTLSPSVLNIHIYTAPAQLCEKRLSLGASAFLTLDNCQLISTIFDTPVAGVWPAPIDSTDC